MYKITDKCFSISSLVNIPCINSAQEYLAGNFKSTYNLDPHITFAIIPLPEWNLEKIKNEIDLYFKNKHRIVLKFAELHVDTKNRFFSLNVKNTRIRKLHEDMLKILERYREGFIREKDLKRIEKGIYSSAQIYNIMHYGFPRVFQQFHPHITIGNITNGHAGIRCVKVKLEEMLGVLTNNEFCLKNVSAFYHSDSIDQSNMEVFWKRTYDLL